MAHPNLIPFIWSQLTYNNGLAANRPGGIELANYVRNVIYVGPGKASVIEMTEEEEENSDSPREAVSSSEYFSEEEYDYFVDISLDDDDVNELPALGAQRVSKFSVKDIVEVPPHTYPDFEISTLNDLRLLLAEVETPYFHPEEKVFLKEHDNVRGVSPRERRHCQKIRQRREAERDQDMLEVARALGRELEDDELLSFFDLIQDKTLYSVYSKAFAAVLDERRLVGLLTKMLKHEVAKPSSYKTFLRETDSGFFTKLLKEATARYAKPFCVEKFSGVWERMAEAVKSEYKHSVDKETLTGRTNKQYSNDLNSQSLECVQAILEILESDVLELPFLVRQMLFEFRYVLELSYDSDIVNQWDEKKRDPNYKIGYEEYKEGEVYDRLMGYFATRCIIPGFNDLVLKLHGVGRKEAEFLVFFNKARVGTYLQHSITGQASKISNLPDNIKPFAKANRIRFRGVVDAVSGPKGLTEARKRHCQRVKRQKKNRFEFDRLTYNFQGTIEKYKDYFARGTHAIILRALPDYDADGMNYRSDPLTLNDIYGLEELVLILKRVVESKDKKGKKRGDCGRTPKKEIEKLGELLEGVAALSQNYLGDLALYPAAWEIRILARDHITRAAFRARMGSLDAKPEDISRLQTRLETHIKQVDQIIAKSSVACRRAKAYADKERESREAIYERGLIKRERSASRAEEKQKRRSRRKSELGEGGDSTIKKLLRAGSESMWSKLRKDNGEPVASKPVSSSGMWTIVKPTNEAPEVVVKLGPKA